MNIEDLLGGFLLGLSAAGMIIEKWEEDVLYISVPKATNIRDLPVGKQLADRIQTNLQDLGINIKIKYMLRDELWTQEKSKQILSAQIYPWP